MSLEKFLKDGKIHDAAIFGPKSDFLSELSNIQNTSGGEFLEEAVKEIVEKRLKELLSVLKPHDYVMTTGTIEEFIHPDSVVENYTNILQSVFFKTGLKLDDLQVYPYLALMITDVLSEGALKGNPIRVAVPFALVNLIDAYFGSYQLGKEEIYRLNTDFSQNGTRSIKEYQQKRIAVCSQIAPFVHNALKFMGYKAALIYSLENIFEGKETAHVFNIFETDEGWTLYDSAQPSAVLDEQGTYLGEFPTLYPLSKEQYESLLKGGTIEADHESILLTNSGEFQIISVGKRTYSGN